MDARVDLPIQPAVEDTTAGFTKPESKRDRAERHVMAISSIEHVSVGMPITRGGISIFGELSYSEMKMIGLKGLSKGFYKQRWFALIVTV